MPPMSMVQEVEVCEGLQGWWKGLKVAKSCS